MNVNFRPRARRFLIIDLLPSSNAWLFTVNLQFGYSAGSGTLIQLIGIGTFSISGHPQLRTYPKPLRRRNQSRLLWLPQDSCCRCQKTFHNADTGTGCIRHQGWLTGFEYSTLRQEAQVYTDDAKAYQVLKRATPATVKHSVRQYVDGMAHIKGVESFWSLLKRGCYWTSCMMSPIHLHRYVDEFEHRHNQ